MSMHGVRGHNSPLLKKKKKVTPKKPAPKKADEK